MRQLIPEKIVRGKGAGLKGPFFYELTAPTAGNLIVNHKSFLNRTMRKYGINTPQRMVAFIGNSIPETSWWGNLNEYQGENTRYAPWYGRGFLQLTNPDGKFTEASNYAKYFHFLGRSTIDISVEKMTKWRLALADKPYDASESAGAYWPDTFKSRTRK